MGKSPQVARVVPVVLPAVRVVPVARAVRPVVPAARPMEMITGMQGIFAMR